MEENKPFSNISSNEAPTDLKESIKLRARAMERRSVRVRFVIQTALSLVSIATVFLSGKYVISVLSTSGFFEYLSLVFVENSTIIGYWRELALSMIESLPALGLGLFLLAITFAISSIARLINILKKGKSFSVFIFA